jgi:hypothetical protein
MKLSRREQRQLRHIVILVGITAVCWKVPQTHAILISILEWFAVVGSTAVFVYLVSMVGIFLRNKGTDRSPKGRLTFSRRPDFRQTRRPTSSQKRRRTIPIPSTTQPRHARP